MRADGTWDPERFVRERQRTLGEVGVEVPPPKKPRVEEPDTVDDNSMPALETSPTAEGKCACFVFQNGLGYPVCGVQCASLGD